MSWVDVRERSRDSPLRARSLFTVRAAISSARSSEAPWSSWLSLMCSYCRARLVPFFTPRGGISCSLCRPKCFVHGYPRWALLHAPARRRRVAAAGLAPCAAVSVRDLREKRCFITGAASGIGRATAVAAAREGALLVLTDIDADGLAATAERIGSQGGTVLHSAPVDVSDYEGVRALP